MDRKREYYRANRDKIRAYRRDRYKHTRARELELMKQWRVNNPLKSLALSQLRKDRIRTRTPYGLVMDLEKILERDESTCYLCDSLVKEFHFDHVIPLSKGGRHTPSNLAIACPICNLAKSNKLPHELPLHFASKVYSKWKELGSSWPPPLTVICGPMFASKTSQLVNYLAACVSLQLDVVALKPEIDARYEEFGLVDHSGRYSLAAQCVPLGQDLLPVTERVIGIDEVQFFEESIVGAIKDALGRKQRIIVSGLDQTFRREPFGVMPTLMALANDVLKLSAVCHKCGADAMFTQRLVDGKPAPFSGETIVVGGLETYEARCSDCHEEGSQ